MSARARREQLRKVGVKDKKLGRLLFCQDLTEQDEWYINYINEERQHLNFFYGMCGVGAVSVGFNWFFFRLNKTSSQLAFVAASSLIGHMIVRLRINKRFEDRINPYFEKYSVK